jgi:hypothetical protein
MRGSGGTRWRIGQRTRVEALSLFAPVRVVQIYQVDQTCPSTNVEVSSTVNVVFLPSTVGSLSPLPRRNRDRVAVPMVAASVLGHANVCRSCGRILAPAQTVKDECQNIVRATRVEPPEIGRSSDSFSARLGTLAPVRSSFPALRTGLCAYRASPAKPKGLTEVSPTEKGGVAAPRAPGWRSPARRRVASAHTRRVRASLRARCGQC